MVYTRILLKKSIISIVLMSIVSLTAFPQTVEARKEETIRETVKALFQKDSIQNISFPQSNTRAPRAVRTMTLTAYTSHANQTDSTPFLPADGKDYRVDFEKYQVVRAIASNDYPLGTELRIPELEKHFPELFAHGEAVFTVRDRMNARYTGKNRMDVYVLLANEKGEIDLDASLKAAKQFGVRRLSVEIL
ncbi:MAG: 3D domain-containing protein [Candidatus Magasanikbacteria bacterium]|jgi:hypothetical protein|nr:3D domain-containing protein [Candidatus Magasanikbacteria bacterium]